jgi:hypothetical protein
MRIGMVHASGCEMEDADFEIPPICFEVIESAVFSQEHKLANALGHHVDRNNETSQAY